MAQNGAKEILTEYFDGEKIARKSDFVAREERVAFYLNGEKLLSVMTLPQDQDAHLVGFLLSEGVVRDVSAIKSLAIAEDGLAVYAEAEIDEAARRNLFREKTLTSGCCVGVTGNVEEKIECDFVAAGYTMRIARLLKAVEKFAEPTELFALTGATHRALILLEDGGEFGAEDIGRHSAIDKAAGKARLAGADLSRSALISSGRLSMEMVMKCVMHRIPIAASKAAVTMQGVKSAFAYGVTLVGFARGGKANIYANSGRIIF
ncbi:MAG: formate dehydrogenase accessory sulfurtransferase FdhD [Helicobacteraceae bacterium]|jgi:FdhD protein|nr:formate dehydrogenase accessory sulfurtransferase FdhD [Helicobacteraceae bacterium]